MRTSPSIVPGINREVYLVLDDFGTNLGSAWREANVEDTDLETVITDLLHGPCSNPARPVRARNISSAAANWQAYCTIIETHRTYLAVSEHNCLSPRGLATCSR